jgi:multiple sugar transport system substrate-binding protein
MVTQNRWTRRAVTASGLGGSLLLAACDAAGGQAPPAPITGPKEVTWSNYIAPSDPRAALWKETWKLAEKATGVKINVIEEFQVVWDKRQTEFAAGMTSADIMYNQTNWVVPGGLQGMFVDLNEYLRRDKVDIKQFYKTGFEMWSWKGKQWGMPTAVGGEVVHFNKKLFDAKGVKYPTKNWSVDDLLDTCRRLNDPANGKYALQIGQNGLHYMMGTTVLSFGGKLLSSAKDQALYGDDSNAVRGAEWNVDLHQKQRFTPTPEAIKGVPSGKQPVEVELVAMEINNIGRHTAIRDAIGTPNLDFAPPPKGPTGIQSAAIAGNSWSILSLSKAKDAAWAALRWLYTKEGAVTPHIEAIGWPPLKWAAETPQWLNQFKGSQVLDAANVWDTGGHEILVLPEGTDAWNTMNAPMNKALTGELGTRDAMQQSARDLNALFGRRPAAWK